MPTFAYNDEDASSQESTSHSHWIRNWLYNSLDVFRRKKFARISAKNEERRKEEKEIEDKARSEALMNFQRKKQEHADSFKPKPKKIIVDVPTTNKLDQSKVWLEEYHHPSSTADISIHEMVGSPVGEVSNREKLDTSWDSTLDLSTTFNSTAKSLFSTSMLAGNTETGEKEATPKLSTLDAYAGTRPSFGVTTVTSTPVAKTFSQQFQAPAKQTTQPPPTAFTKPSPAVKSTPLFEQTPILKTSTPAKLVPIPESTFEICVPSPVKPPTPAPVISRPESPVSKSPFNNLVMHYSADLDRKEDNDIAKDRFEKSGDTNLRGAIKRTINERLSVCSKKHATAAELTPTIVFLASLMGGKVVDSYNGQSKLQVLDEGAVAYTYDTLIKYSLSVVDKDDNLVFVMGSILRGICQKNSTFESVLFGHLFYSSALLAFDDHISTKFVKSILSDPGRKTLAYGKEQSVIKLFFALHLVNEGEESGKSRLTMSNLWKTAAFILNSPPCIFSTLFLVIAFIEICSDKMKTVYPRQWPKLVSTIQNQLMPLLETNLLSSKLSEEADEARYITVLRSRLENL